MSYKTYAIIRHLRLQHQAEFEAHLNQIVKDFASLFPYCERVTGHDLIT